MHKQEGRTIHLKDLTSLGVLSEHQTLRNIPTTSTTKLAITTTEEQNPKYPLPTIYKLVTDYTEMYEGWQKSL